MTPPSRRTLYTFSPASDRSLRQASACRGSFLESSSFRPRAWTWLRRVAETTQRLGSDHVDYQPLGEPRRGYSPPLRKFSTQNFRHVEFP
jgi:hypothetical protein